MESYHYWSLNERPFDENSAVKFFYGSNQHQEALDRLIYVVESNNMGIGLLTGEVGSGKTMTINALLSTVTENEFDYEYAVLETSNFSYVDILTEIVSQICKYDVKELPHTKYKLYNMLRNYIETKIITSDKKLIIVMDEAQKIKKNRS